MTDQYEDHPDKSPLPILLFLAMLVVYASGTGVGLVGSGAFAYSGWNSIGLALLVGTVLFLVTLVLSLVAIRMIASGTQRIAGIIWYLVCLVLCLIVGVVIVPTLTVSFIKTRAFSAIEVARQVRSVEAERRPVSRRLRLGVKRWAIIA